MGRKLSKRLESPWNTIMGSPGGSDDNLPGMQETKVQSLGWEDPLKKRMGAISSDKR